MTTLFQLQLDQSLVDCGMSYVFQLSSGHFFVLDGGYFTPDESERLYQMLRTRSGGRKPVIDGWFFSHAHQDHIGVFMDFIETHLDDVEIRELVFNFQPLQLPESSAQWRVKCQDLATIKRFYELLAEKCSRIPVRTPHTGDIWRYGELEIEVLFTHEELDVPTNFNDHSTVILVRVAQQRILFLGDINAEGSRIMLEKRSEKLRCDIVQVSHHGFDGATPELYAATHAKVALWPSPVYVQGEIRRRLANQYLHDRSGIAEHMISGYGSAAMQLPYQPFSAKRFVSCPVQYVNTSREP